MFYLLNVDTPEPTDLMTWAKMFQGNQHLWHITLELPSGALVFVSTVFLGFDHSFGMGGPPLLFETMIFNWPGHEHEEQWRYTSYAAAERGHKEAVALVVESS